MQCFLYGARRQRGNKMKAEITLQQVVRRTALLLLPWLLGQALALEIPAHHSLHDALHHFEVLHVSQLSHHSPPHTCHPHNRETTHLYFRTLDRDFNLILTPSLTTVHNSLHVTVVTERGRENRPFPFTHFYNGYLLGSPDSHVIAHLQPTSGLLTASVHTPTEVYYIEPLSRLLPGQQSHDSHMISYKHSHLKFNLTGQTNQQFCGNHDNTLPEQQESSPWEQRPTTPQYEPTGKATNDFLSTKAELEGWGEKQRVRRDLAGDVCTLHLVVTPSFHNQTSNDPDTTALFLLGLISGIDKNIFQVADFTTNPSKLGLFVTNITIYESTTDSSTPEYAREGEKNSERLLRIFSQEDWSGTCLAHLFTAVRFDDERLGVAYVASRKRDDAGGICSPLVGDDVGRKETANVGVTSFRNADNRPLLFAEGRLVTAHEIGHGWGSEHDPGGDPRCSPPLGRTQGKFLMFPSATDGDQTNNAILSPCSVDMISDVVQRKGSCFKERSQLEGLCGNYMVDEVEEECDAGALGLVDKDPCCTSECRLRSSTLVGGPVECSDVNSDCCENCRISSPEAGKICQANGEGNTNCLRDVFCMGEKVCPGNLAFELRFVDENSTCGQLGRCLPPKSTCNIDGDCVTPNNPDVLNCYNFCKWHGLEECFCSGADECKFCCLQTDPSTGNRTCTPFNDMSRPDRSSCIGGFCDHGVCVPASQDLIQRLFELFDNPSLNTVVEFMRENIVGTVIVLSLLLWVPGSFLLSVFDAYIWRRHKRVAREYEADLQDAQLEDEDDLFEYDNVFEEMEHSQPGVLRPEAKFALMRLDSGASDDYFGGDDRVPLIPHVPVSASDPYSGFWDNRLSTITEESAAGVGGFNPERDNIHLYSINRTPRVYGDKGTSSLQQSLFDTEHVGTLV